MKNARQEVKAENKWVNPKAAELKQPWYLGGAFLYPLLCILPWGAVVLLLCCPRGTPRPMAMKGRYHDNLGDACAENLAPENVMDSLRFCFSLSFHSDSNFDLFPFYIPWFSQSLWAPLDFDQVRLELSQKLQQVQKLLKIFALQCDFLSYVPLRNLKF